MMKRINFEEEEDRISSLIDCLIIEILSRLDSTKEVIRTCTLSKRWKHVWTLVPTLKFTYDDKPNRKKLFGFFSSIEKTINQCGSQLKLNIFQLLTFYDVRFESQLNNLVRYAISRNVEHVSLCLPSETGGFVLDQFFFTSSCFTDLNLGYCVFNPTGAISWKNLKSLCISNGKLDEDLIANILSGSPLLETFNMESCFGFRRLDITSKSVKNIGLFGVGEFDQDRVNHIKINAPSILSLTIKNVLILKRLFLLDVSSLVKAKLDYHRIWNEFKEETDEEMLKRLILKLRHVKEVTVGRSCSLDLSRLKAKGFISPLNVKAIYFQHPRLKGTIAR